MSARKPILRPDRNDEAWEEFAEALSVPIFGQGLCMGGAHQGSARFYFAERLLEARGFDVEASLALYEQHGGYCDCEILFNADPRLNPPAHEEEQLTGDEGDR